jgi:phenylacetic acid degradation operon negative regulatory protein
VTPPRASLDPDTDPESAAEPAAAPGPEPTSFAPGPTPPGPAFTRRQQTGSATARSLLLTVFGEYVLPQGRPVWTTALLPVLAGLDVEEKSARQALARMAADGWISSERVGRRVRWGLTDSGRELLEEGARRIYSFGRERDSWDGGWLVVLASVPESQRELRHRLRTGLTWSGFGSPAPGVWITPHAARAPEAAKVLAGLGLRAAASFRGPFAGVGEQRTMVEQAWHLGALAEEYERFVAEFEEAGPRTGDEILLAQVRLVHEWRRFPRVDPQLPSELLPPHWIGLRAAALFEDLHQRWHATAQACWTELSML